MQDSATGTTSWETVGWRSGRGTGGAPFGRAMNYYDYLNSKSWQRRRAEARKRAKGRCRVCGSTENLHTHHKTYKRLGKETQADLVVLCKTHHFACHDFIKLWKTKGWKHKSDYTLTMKYIARERKKQQRQQEVQHVTSLPRL